MVYLPFLPALKVKQLLCMPQLANLCNIKNPKFTICKYSFVSCSIAISKLKKWYFPIFNTTQMQHKVLSNEPKRHNLNESAKNHVP